MREWLAFQCGRLFVFWYDLCGTLDRDMAFGVLAEMFYTLVENDEDARNKMLLKLAPHFRRDEFSRGR